MAAIPGIPSTCFGRTASIWISAMHPLLGWVFGAGARYGGRIGRAVMTVLLMTMYASACAAQTEGRVIGDLASGWSGNPNPECKMFYGTLPDGAVDSLKFRRECEWRAATDGEDLGRIWGSTDGQGAAVMWHRPTKGVEEASRFVDSLSVALRARGLQPHDCEEGEVPAGMISPVLWSDSDLAVYVSRITPPDGPPRFAIVATDMPASFPQVMKCGAVGVPPRAP